MINLLSWFFILLIIIIIIIGIEIRFKLRIEKRAMLICLFIICMLPIMIEIINNKYQSGYLSGNMIDLNNPTQDGYVLDLIEDGDVYEQSFYSTYSHLKTIGIYILTYERKNEGFLEVELIDDTDNVEVSYWKINMNDLDNYKYLELSIENPEAYNTAEKNFRIRLKTSGTEEYRNISLKKSDDEYDDGELFINGVKTGSDIVFYVSGYESEYSLTRARIWVCIYIYLLIVIIWNIVREKGRHYFAREIEVD